MVREASGVQMQWDFPWKFVQLERVDAVRIAGTEPAFFTLEGVEGP